MGGAAATQPVCLPCPCGRMGPTPWPPHRSGHTVVHLPTASRAIPSPMASTPSVILPLRSRLGISPSPRATHRAQELDAYLADLEARSGP